ncbi:MAG: mevalonate kinase [Zestosphaera sp.]
MVASAPGKITLFGEHAVVYGYPAIVVAINKKVRVTAEVRDDDNIRINAQDLKTPGVIVSISNGEIQVTTDYGRTLSAIGYLSKAIELTSEYLGVRKGVNLEVKSEMPVGAGLGTSAAVSIATIAAYSSCLGYELSKEEVAGLGWEVERNVQGIASPMDTSIATFGGVLKVQFEGDNVYRTPVNVGGEPVFVLAYVEREKTTREMLMLVKSLREKHPDLINGILEHIGKVVLEAEKALVKGDLAEVGMLMNVNHGLLEAIGVSSRRLSEVIYVARVAGALGSKLTGGGGGGASVALTLPGNAETLVNALKLVTPHVFEASIYNEGVTIERL